jgi:hypothetical protein
MQMQETGKLQKFMPVTRHYKPVNEIRRRSRSKISKEKREELWKSLMKKK